MAKEEVPMSHGLGVYCYTATKDMSIMGNEIEEGDIVYIGIDRAIHKNKRHRDHFQPSNKDRQLINTILQNYTECFEYHILRRVDLTYLQENGMDEEDAWDECKRVENKFLHDVSPIFNVKMRTEDRW